MKGLVEPGSDGASASGTDEEGTDEETDNEAEQDNGNLRQPSSDVVPDNNDAKGEERIASGDENVKIERIAVKTGKHLIDQFESVYFGTAFAFYLLVQLWVS